MAGEAFDLDPAEFRRLGHDLVERIGAYLETVWDRPAAPDTTPREVRARVGADPLPEAGSAPEGLLAEAAELLLDLSRHNSHPRSWGYVIGSPAPIGILGDFLASAINPNLAAWTSSPAATEIELQAVRWIAELLGYPAGCGGLLTSGGNMANFIGFLAARRAKAPWDLRKDGMAAEGQPRLTAYVSEETHTWVQKAADLFGLGTDAIRWIGTDGQQRLRMDELRGRIEKDRAAGCLPFLLVGAAGTVSTGAVDPLTELAALAEAEGLWFHVDGAYGAPAVMSDLAPAALAGLRRADSLAIDGHKWLFAPLEAGCALVRDRDALLRAFSYRPSYYHHQAADEVTNFYELGPQNSRCFRALKVWLILRRAGAAQYRAVVGRNLEQAREMHRLLQATPEIDAATQSLSITTFRYRPEDLTAGQPEHEAYLNALNEALLTRLQKSGEVFLSNAVIGGRFLLRACITNFRTRPSDIAALPEVVRRHGQAQDRAMRPAALRNGQAG